MLLGIMICLGAMAGFILTRARKVECYKINSPVMRPFYKMGDGLFSLLESDRPFAKRLYTYVVREGTGEFLHMLYPARKNSLLIKEYYVGKTAIGLAVVTAGGILSILAMCVSGGSKELLEGRYLSRGSYEEGGKTTALKVSAGTVLEQEEVSIYITERQYEEEQVYEMFQETKAELDTIILKDNTSLEEIRSDLYLPERLPGRPLEIRWDTSQYDIISGSGAVNNEDLKTEGVKVTIYGKLTYLDFADEYTTKVWVFPPAMSEKEKLLKELGIRLEQSDAVEPAGETVALPDDLNGIPLKWKEVKADTALSAAVIFLFAGLLVFIAKDEELKEAVNKRNQQMLVDYPEIVSKLTLLLGSGMTIRGAWQKVALDYRRKKEENAGCCRFAYEEMLVTHYEIAGGVQETRAYENFGRRCRHQRYMKLASLITQNTRKGAKGLSKILEGESLEAFEDRKAAARTMGEEAGTKLMLPMFLTLAVVLVMIMIPAFLSFQI